MTEIKRQYGFTLLEILISLVIVGGLLSVTYAAWSAAAVSTGKYSARITLAAQARSALGALTRQIASTFIVNPSSENNTAPKSNQDANRIYFYSNASAGNNGLTLQFIANVGILQDHSQPQGPFLVKYFYDKQQRALLYNQQKYLPDPINDEIANNWTPLIENVNSIELEFFDGEQWRDDINAGDKYALTQPRAVRIKLTLITDNETVTDSFETVVALNNNNNYHENKK